ncbi:MAG TPA: copper resistance protein CopC, partial [Acidimicrobiales bacterium]|nr:copper resistance protein CopC [Acidimicrobiales bacterium]
VCRRWPGRLVVALALVAGGLLAPAAPASAHTELVSSRPAPQAVLPAAPATVTLEFSGSVEVGAEAVRVLDPAGRRADAGAATTSAGGRTVSAPVRPDPGTGVFTVSWQVVAADGHPLRGAFTFRAGTGSAARPTASTAVTSEQRAGGGAVGVLLGLARWLAFAGLVVLVGAVAFLHAVWTPGWQDRRAARLVWAGWAAAVAGTAGGLVLQGPSVTGRSLGHALDAALLREVAGTRVGGAWLVRLALLAAVAAVLARRRPAGPAAAWAGRASWAVTGGALLVTAAVAGHAATADAAALAVATDTIHLAAVAVWLGGLAVMAAAVLRSPDVDHSVPARFSRIALACVALIVVTGSVQTWREVGSAGALTDTRYGALLLAKVAVFAVLLGAAAVSRRWVQGRVRRSPLRLLRRSVGAEAALAAVVLAVASVLVATPPGRTAYAPPFRADLPLGPRRLVVEVAPARVGAVQVDVRTTAADGTEAPVTFVVVELRLPRADVGPLFVRMQRLSAGHYRASGVDLPLPGRWRLDAEVFLGRGASTRSTTSFVVS